MIVSQDNAGTAFAARIDDDLPQWKVGADLVAAIARDVKAAGVVVHVGDPQAFAARILFREAAREELAGGREPVELQRGFGTLIPHPD
jgi:hypothetical protein